MPDDADDPDDEWEEVDVFGDRKPGGPAASRSEPTGDQVAGAPDVLDDPEAGAGGIPEEPPGAWDPPEDATAAREAVDALDAGEGASARGQAMGPGGHEPTAEGPCHVCGDADGQHVCVSCEGAACSDHFWVMFALCRGCATEEEIQRLQGHRDDRYWRDVLGIKWVS